jgi:hypothetical protein
MGMAYRSYDKTMALYNGLEQILHLRGSHREYLRCNIGTA